MILIHAALLACLAQDAVPPQAPAPAPAPARTGTGTGTAKLVNRVQFVVNDSVITLDNLLRELRIAQQRLSVSSEQEDAQLRQQITMARVMDLLMIQAGEDLGRPQEEIDRIVDDWSQYMIDRAGGAREYSEGLERDEKDPLRQRRELTEEFYSYTYGQIVTGLQPGPLGRPYVDRYSRPGTIRRVYDEIVRSGIGLERIQGKGKSFVLQQLVLEVSDQPALEQRLLQARELRRRALDGEDFNALVDAYSDAPGNRSISTDIQLDDLAVFGRECFEWARKAEEESISPVVPMLDPERRIVGWRILRVMDVEDPIVPPFDSLETQMRIETLLSNRRDERLKGLALQELLDVAYVYPDRNPAQEVIDARLERARAEIGKALPGVEPVTPTPPAGEAPPEEVVPPVEPAPADKLPPEPVPQDKLPEDEKPEPEPEPAPAPAPEDGR